VIPLRLRVSNRGFTWVYHGRLNGQPRRHPLGTYPKMSLEQARAAAMRLSDAGAVQTSVTTLGQLREAYIASTEFAALAKRTQQSYQWVLEGKDYAPFNARKVRDITRQDVLGLKDQIAASGRAYQNLLRPLQALLTWAVDRGYIDVSPATRLRLPQNEADPHPFSDAELGEMVYTLEHRGVDEPYRTLYLLVAYTGQRPSTWAEAKWSEIDLKKGTLTVSRSRARTTKLGQGWAVPLSALVVQALTALREAQGKGRNEWLFGRPLVVEQKARNRIAKLAGMADEANRGTLHRFRATMLTKLNEWGAPLETQQRLAGHASPMAGSRAHYVTPAPTAEMRRVADEYSGWVRLQGMM
jgi:integrase